MILSIDIGTSTCKAALFRPDGTMEDMVKVPLALVSDRNGSQEADPRMWVDALHTLCRGFEGLSRVRAIVVSGNGPTVVPVNGSPAMCGDQLCIETGFARLWLDRRAVLEAEEISRITGTFIDSSFTLPQVLHLFRTRPESYHRARWFLSSCEFINYLLTQEAKAILHASDGIRWYWTEDLLDAVGLDARKFPPFIHPGDLVGMVTDQAAHALGLPRDVPVFAAGPDFLVSILGCAVVRPGLVCDRAGTSEGINLCTEHPLGDDRLMTYRHPVVPYHNVSGIISTSGKAIEWAGRLLGVRDASYDELYTLMGESPAGCGGVLFLPYLQGERAPIWDPAAKGVFSGLSLATGKGELLRSVAEGTCLAIRDVIEVMEESGGRVESLRTTGGPSESSFLNQLKADITGRALSVPKIPEAELVGSMVIGLTALGEYASLAEAAGHLVRMGRTYEPRKEYRQLYDELFARYRETYRCVRDTWREA